MTHKTMPEIMRAMAAGDDELLTTIARNWQKAAPDFQNVRLTTVHELDFLNKQSVALERIRKLMNSTGGQDCGLLLTAIGIVLEVRDG